MSVCYKCADFCFGCRQNCEKYDDERKGNLERYKRHLMELDLDHLSYAGAERRKTARYSAIKTYKGDRYGK